MRIETEKGPSLAERKHRQFWAVDNGDVMQVIGYECGRNKDYWWVPERHWSGRYGSCLFDTRREALTKLVELSKENVMLSLRTWKHATEALGDIGATRMIERLTATIKNES